MKLIARWSHSTKRMVHMVDCPSCKWFRVVIDHIRQQLLRPGVRSAHLAKVLSRAYANYDTHLDSHNPARHHTAEHGEDP